MKRQLTSALLLLACSAACISTVAAPSPPSPPSDRGLHRVCGSCKDLLPSIIGVPSHAIGDKADSEQSRGDLSGASATMCAGMCSGALLLDAHSFANLGVLLKAQGHAGAAVACYRASLRLNPAIAVQHYRLGNAHMALHEFGKARSEYSIATARMPRYGDAYNNLGNCLMSMSHWDDAEKAYDYAVRSNPLDANYYCNLGGVVARRDISKAIELLQEGLRLNPEFGEVYNNLANYLRDQGRLGEARDAYERALVLMPRSGEVLVNMASAQAYLCDWRRRSETHRLLIKRTEAELGGDEDEVKRRLLSHSGGGSTVSLGPFYASAFGMPPALVRRVAHRFALDAEAKVAYLLSTFTTSPPKPPSMGVLRLGIISSDLTNHIVGHGISALLRALDKTRFRVYTYPLTADDGSASRAAIASLSTARSVAGLSAEAIALRINADALHVLLDLNGHTKGNQMEILALRPCETQVLFHGYAGTSGGSFMHHFITDKIVVPPDLSRLISEKLLYMPNSFFLWEDYGDPLPLPLQPSYTPPDMAGTLPEGHGFVFACFNNLYKVSPRAFKAWSEILASTPSSILWLMKLPPGAETRLWAEAEARNLSQARLIASDLFPRGEHLRYKGAAGLFLDTMSYNAHSTACDSLAAGVPILTLPGGSMPARVGASLVKNAGMSLLTARNAKDYVRIAVQVAEGGGKRAKGLKERLGRELGGAPLFDRQNWTRDFEALLRSAVDMASSMGGGEAVKRMHYAGHPRSAAGDTTR